MQDIFNRCMDVLWYKSPIYRFYYWLRYEKIGYLYKGKRIGDDSEPIWQIYETGDCLKIGDYIAWTKTAIMPCCIYKITHAPKYENDEKVNFAYCLPNLEGHINYNLCHTYPMSSQFELKKEDVFEQLLDKKNPCYRISFEAAVASMIHGFECEQKAKFFTDKYEKCSITISSRLCNKKIKYYRPYLFKKN